MLCPESQGDGAEDNVVHSSWGLRQLQTLLRRTPTGCRWTPWGAGRAEGKSGVGGVMQSWGAQQDGRLGLEMSITTGKTGHLWEELRCS